MSLPIRKKVALAFAVSVVALTGVGWLSYHTTARLISILGWVAHSHQVIAALESGRAILTDAETKQRSFLLTGEDLFLQDCRRAQAKVGGWSEQVRKLMKSRERVERQIEDGRALLQSIVDNTPAVVFLKDLEGRYLFTNRRFQRLTGRSHEEMIGKTAFDLTPIEVAKKAQHHHETV